MGPSGRGRGGNAGAQPVPQQIMIASRRPLSRDENAAKQQGVERKPCTPFDQA